jgi:hypothetical protein
LDEGTDWRTPGTWSPPPLTAGYEKQQEAIRRLFGNDIVEKVSEVRGFNVDGFMKNMWTRTCQDHLWIMGGALMEARLYSRFLTLRIKADLEGVSPRAR